MIRIYDSMSKTTLKAAVLISTFLLCAVAMGFGQSVNLTAGPTTVTLPDGTTVPMWGYTCGTATATPAGASCAPLSGSSSAAGTGALGGFYVINGGQNYSSAATVVITPAAGNTPTTVAVATPVISGGQVVGFSVTNHGAGYTAAPTVTISDTTGTGAVVAAAPSWSPVVITVPFNSTGTTSMGTLTINLTNNLSFGNNQIPTSIVIVGQVGGGLGGTPTTTQSPDHSLAQGCPTWFIATLPPGTPCNASNAGPSGTPPLQANRVRSMGAEVAAGAVGTATATSLTWSALKPGTYLLESGTHPSIQVPMGLIGMLVVTTTPGATSGAAGLAYPAVTPGNAAAQVAVPQVQYNAEVPLEFSEIDPVQNKAVDVAVRTPGFSETTVWTAMSGAGVVTSLNLTSGGSGYSAPLTVSVTPTDANGSGATATATLSYAVASATVASGGTGYAVGDTISLGGGSGSGAVATVATITGTGTTGPVATVTISAPGAGYTSAPTADTTLTGTGSGAALTATLATTGSVAAVTLTSAGDGYTTVPTVTVTGGAGTGASITASLASGGCGTTHTCYPPAVNYTPFYYLINGVAFDKASPNPSLFNVTQGTNTGTIAGTGTVLIRLVNAGLRMHVPAIVGSQTKGFSGSGATATVNGFTLIAEDGNPVPANLTAPRVKTEVFMAAGKTYDVMVNVPATSLPIFDRELSLSANSSVRDAGMLAYIGINGSGLPAGTGGASGVFASAQAVADIYKSIVGCSTAPCTPLAISDPSKGVIANDVNVYGAQLSVAPTQGTLTCNAVPNNPVPGICANGTFTYTPNVGTVNTTTMAFVGDVFTYCANGTSNICATVTLGGSTLTGNPTANNISYTSNIATFLKISSPGVLSVDSDPNGLPLQVVLSSVTPPAGVTINMDAQGGFTAAAPGAGTYTFTYIAQNSQGRQSGTATVTLVFPQPSNLQVNVLDAQAYAKCNRDSSCISNLVATGKFSDYRWIIEEDKTFYIDPNCTANSSILTSGCPSVVGQSGQSTIPTFGVNFHTSTMGYVAQGCTGPMSCEGGQTMLDTRPACTSPGVPAGCSATSGTHILAVCDLGNGACRPDPTGGQGSTAVFPSQVALDPSKRYYISILPGDAGNPFPGNVQGSNCNGIEAQAGDTTCGHTMSGAPIAAACNILVPGACSSAAFTNPVNVLVLPTPLPTGSLSVLVFEDDFPLNGEQDGGGGAGGAIAPIEPGLGGFNIVLWDTFGGLGDVTGQDTFDMFNMPLSNSLAGTIDPDTQLDACPISATPLTGPAGGGPAPAGGITGMIVTCPKYESDGVTLSPLAGQAVIANLMPDKFSVQAYPGADRIARGEEWIQTNTLDGQHPHDSFIRIGEPSYFQEYGPAGYHVMIGFANPAVINARHNDICNGFGTPGSVGPCTNSITGQVNVQRLSRIPDERLYPSGSHDALAWTQCWVSLGDPDGEDFMFTKCDANGNFRFTNVPGGNWRLTIGDQWNDQIIDGLSTAANVGCTSTAPNGPTTAAACPGGQTLNLGTIGVQQWQSNLYTKTCVDDNKNGICDPGEIGIPLIYTMIHYRDGHNANALTTDFNGVAPFNETFPLFNWYVVEADSTRYKTTGTHVVYDAGGPADGTSSCGTGNGARACGTSTAYKSMSNTFEAVPLPKDLSVPGAVYCQTADCAGEAGSFAAGTAIPSSLAASTGRIDPPWVWSEGWAGLTGHSNWIEFAKTPYASCPPACVTVGNSVVNLPTQQAITAAAEGSTVTITTSGTLPASVGDSVTIAGVATSGYNGTFTVTSLGTGTFSYTDSTPGLAADTSGGTFIDNNAIGGSQQTITAANEGAATVTITSAAVPKAGDSVTITGVTPAGYDGTFTVATVGTGTFSYSYSGAGALAAGTGGTFVDNSVGVGGTTASTTQAGENGGIYGTVNYAATRPFDDASMMIEQPWQPYVPNVTVNLYQEGFATDGVTPTLTMVDTTTTSSWDAWAQGFYPNSTAGTGSQKPYMSCPGQGTATAGSPNQDLFYFTLFDQPNYLDYYNSIHNGGTLHPLPYNSQFKCYDAMKINNQIQPAPYDGKYFFPSSLGLDPTTGKLLPTKGATNGVTSSMAGTNCTICVANPDSTDPYRSGNPMLPPGKYVVQVIMPPGYEVEKEEDKNLLIGDNFIAPVTQQFGGVGTNVYIMPDQASVASMYEQGNAGYNGTNYQNSTTGEGLGNEMALPGFPGYTDPTWPCVGEMRVVPDYLSLFPGNLETAPFAGATRPLCDRKEVTLTNQMAVNARFFIFTSTHIASKYTGVITDDFTSEFDPFSPQFGEKFAPPNMPISTKDYLGNELSRVYSDHWGIYNGLTFSSWNVNPPNITGYSPAMMTQCMNDPGPISNGSGATMADPLYNPAYSDFCYEEPYMPGLTTYLDTPVVPTQAFVGAGYNNPDCSYPDATPAISEVDGDGIGPWVSAAGKTLTINALGDQQVNNNAYSGPSANVAPFNQKTINRHYGFGSQCTAVSSTCAAVSTVTIGGQPATIGTWNDSQITVTVPSGVPNCAIQQQAQYGGSTAQCGQLLITAGNGKQSVDTVTVTIGGSMPKHVAANQTIQSAIDAAYPGDLIIVDPTCTTSTSGTTGNACSGTVNNVSVGTITGTTPAAHVEMLLMWKPVRLQGVGAATSVIDSNAFPAGKLLDPWRRHVNCLFGLTLQGVPMSSATTGSYDPTGTYNCPETGWNQFVGSPVGSVPQVDRIPLEAVVGWDATLNGNLAEQLQEPSLMGAYEGAGITVLAKGVWTPPGQSSFQLEGSFPAGSLLLQNVPAALDETGAPIAQQYDYCTTPGTTTEMKPNPYPSNFECNPSSIDGLTIRDSSQGGGGVFVHGWNHNLQIANNRIYNNAGTLSGGISLGQGEFPPGATVVGVVGGVGEESSLDALPSCQDSAVVGTHLPYCLDNYVNMHNNAITGNSSLGDELFSGTLAGGGGASFCTGADYYKFNYNWVCGNVSSAEGGGITHLGFNYFGDIEHNTIALNESANPTIPTNGGGIMVMGTPDTDPVCTAIPDADCPPGLSDGTGPGLVINANLIQSNGADSGSGGGIRLQQVNGTEVSSFPTQPIRWNSVSLTNNIIVNNIAGWDGAGISLQDALNVSIVNNTISSNDSLASSGVLTQSIGTPMASAPAGSCVQNGPSGASTASCPQPSGLSSTPNSSLLTTTLVGSISCPNGTTGCKAYSNPLLQNNVIWQNRSFYIGITGAGTGNVNQQNQVGLFEAFTGTAAPAQNAFGQCGTASYWDIGVRGDMSVTGHQSGFRLNPMYSVLDDTGYDGSNLTSNPSIVSQYCNGGRVPPTCTVADGCGGPSGYGVPPGIVDASTPNPVFSLTPTATVDEGNNWINVSWGPLALSDDSVLALTPGNSTANYGGGNAFGNYALNANSPAIDYVPVNGTTFPATLTNLAKDFFGNPRPDAQNTNVFDVGAVEYQQNGTNPTPLLLATVTPTTLAFGNVNVGTTSTVMSVTVTNTGNTALPVGTFTFGGGTTQPFAAAGTGNTCNVALAVAASCTYTVVFKPTATGFVSRTLTVAFTGATVTGSPVTLTGTGVQQRGRLSFTGATGSGTLSNGNTRLTFTIPSPRAAVTSTVTITNTGAGSLQITAETLSGANSNLFSITDINCLTASPLAPSGTCTVSLKYNTPSTAPGTPNAANANFANNGSGTNFAGNTVLSLRGQ